MNETSIDTANNTDNNSERDPFHITSLCYSEPDWKGFPVYPYVVAFTGHRDIIDKSDEDNRVKQDKVDGVRKYTEVEIKTRFKEELEELAKLWKKKSGGIAPLILLTGLAEGSDQIVAQAALELKDLNVKVIAVLPMDRDTFELTIESENAQQKYRNLLKQVDDIYELPLEDEVRSHESELNNKSAEAEDLRRIQYRLQAEFVSLHSHIHFVFWDGIDIDSQGGGTGETVMFKLEGNTRQTSSNFLTFSSIGPVVHFLIPRNNDANKNEPLSNKLNMDEIPVFYWTRDRLRQLGKSKPDRSDMNESYRLHTPVAKIEEVKKVIEAISALNTDSSLHAQNYSPESEEYQKIWDKLFGIKESQDNDGAEIAQQKRVLAKQFIDRGTNIFIDHYVIADKLASKYQGITKSTITLYAWVLFIFLLTSGLINLLGNFSNGDGATTAYKVISVILIFIYELALIVTVWLFRKSNEEKNHYKYHYYRSMAEALRVQIFWRIALLSGCVSAYYRSHQIFKTEWLRAAINSLDVLIPSPQKESVDSTRNRIDFVKERWVEEQQNYLTNQIIKNRQTSFFDKIFKPEALFIYTVATLISVPFIGFIQHSPIGFTGSPLVKGIVVFVTALYAAYTIYAQKPIKIAEANRYEREIFPFDRAALLLSKDLTTAPEEEVKIKQDVLRQLGEEALAGNSDWLLSADKRSLSLHNIKLDKG